MVYLYGTNSLTMTGSINVDGTTGGNAGRGGWDIGVAYDCTPNPYDGGGWCVFTSMRDGYGGSGGGAGGGSGGGILLRSDRNINITGSLYARGGNGGTDNEPRPSQGSCYGDYGGGGGGGGGGRIKIISTTCSSPTTYNISPSVASVAGGSGGSYYGYYGTRYGDPGSYGSYRNDLKSPGPGSDGAWTGNIDNKLDNECNWGNYKVPSATSAVSIPGAPSSGRYPRKTGNMVIGGAVCQTLTMASSGTPKLTVTGNWAGFGTFNRGIGEVIFEGSTNSLISRGGVPCSGSHFTGSGSNTYSYCPIYGFYNYSRSMTLIRRDELFECAGGNISNLAVYVNSTGSHAFTNIEIRVKKTTLSEIPTTWDGTGTLVWSGNYTFSSTGWITFTFSSTFNWDTDNLLITFQHGHTAYTSNYPYFRYTPTTYYSQSYNYSDYSLPTAMSQTYNRLKFRLNFTGSVFHPVPKAFMT
jgi:hypothetical protein